MLNFIPKLKLDKVKEGGGGGAPPVEPKVDPAATPPAPKVEEGGDTHDELGYEKVPAPASEKEKAGDKPVEKKTDEPKAPEKVENPATGYGDEPPKVEPPAKKVEEVPPVKDELDPVVEGLPKVEADKIKEFAKKHSASKEIIKAFADLRKSEIEADKVAAADYEKDLEREKQQVKADWHKELKDDPVFGGEKFSYNISRAEKVLEEFMPSTKKTLTERKGILPPYVMRDLAKLAEHLYSTERLVQGEPKAEVKDDKAADDPLAFYE